MLRCAWVAVALLGCGIHYGTPRIRLHDGRFGYLAGQGTPPSARALCRDWRGALAGRDSDSGTHVSFPETAPQLSCFTPVHYTDDTIEVGDAPANCLWPDEADRTSLTDLAARLDAMASRPGEHEWLLPCALTPEHRRAALAHNARVLRATAERAGRPGAQRYPYAAVVAFGYGWPDQVTTSVVDWQPGDACHRPTQHDLDKLGVMVLRARRVADALRAGVAPLAIVSGGTEHSRMVEAFAMLYLLHCALGVREDRVLLEPCAEHTHTNVRNSARWLVPMGARAAYIVTDDGIQDIYFQEFSGLELVFGSLDQRSIRDWGYIMGSWRQAATGPNVGYWFSPYRFWAEPRDGLGSMSCEREGSLD